MRPASTLERLAPLTGVLFVALLVASFIVGGESPDADASTQEVVEFWADDDTQILSAILGALAAVFVVWFGASLSAALRRFEGEPGRLSSLVFAGFIILAVGASAFCGFQFAAADTVNDVPPEVTQTLSVLFSDFFFPLAVGNMVALIASGISILRHGALPSWLGYLALVLGIAAVTPVGFFAFLGAGIWVLVVSVLLYGDANRQSQGPPPPIAA